MPLNRPALSLGSGPRGVQDARRWVVGTCEDIHRADLVECAELGVSELVTNALLHARPPLAVRVRGTREHPRVEVLDGTPEPPRMPVARQSPEEDLLLTFGRGLGIVARCSTAWGVDLEADRKTVWFAPAADLGRTPVTGVVTGRTGPDRAAPAGVDDLRVVMVGVPLRTFVEFERHYHELRREVRLLALAHESDYPLAKDLSDLFGSLERDLREGIGAEQVEQALVSGATTADLSILMPRAAATTIDRFLDLLDRADDFCRKERLLSLARTAAQRRFQRWFLGEFIRQERHEAPLPWHDAAVTPAQSFVS